MRDTYRVVYTTFVCMQTRTSNVLACVGACAHAAHGSARLLEIQCAFDNKKRFTERILEYLHLTGAFNHTSVRPHVSTAHVLGVLIGKCYRAYNREENGRVRVFSGAAPVCGRLHIIGLKLIAC